MKEVAFITGIDGFVGAHLAKKLLEKNYEVIGLSHMVHKPTSTLTKLGLSNKVTKIIGDVQDIELMKYILAKYNVKYVYHLAAQAIVAVALKDPLNTYKINCIGTATILDACRDVNSTTHNTQIKAIMIVTTDKVYGEGMNRKETDELNADGIYETSKICEDFITKAFTHIYNLPTVVTRACNIYGEYDFNRRIIPNTLLRLKEGTSPVIFNNEDSIREYVYVDDVVDAYIMLAENIATTRGQAYNIGSGHYMTQEKLVNTLIEVSGTGIKPTYVEKAKDLIEIFQQTINCDKIKSLGWSPKYNIEEGLRRTWQQWQV
jgi:CDP-glucose 4,6-dehydratase